MNIVQFRKDLPEFSDTARYTDEVITFWATIAETMVVAKRWKTMTDTGVKLYVAHEITLAANNIKTGSIGGTPGSSPGIATSKTVGSVTVAYDANVGAEKDAGWWNLTTYGKQFIRLAKILGAGAIQL